MIYSYTKTVTEGPNGTVYTFKGVEGCVELATIDGINYVYVPNEIELPEQLEEINLTEVDTTALDLKPLLKQCQVLKLLEAQVDTHLDAIANEHDYKTIELACMYASAPNPYQAESQLFVEWCGSVWETYFDAINTAITTGEVLPSWLEIKQVLPAFEVA